jgi:hypothetical protein
MLPRFGGHHLKGVDGVHGGAEEAACPPQVHRRVRRPRRGSGGGTGQTTGGKGGSGGQTTSGSGGAGGSASSSLSPNRVSRFLRSDEGPARSALEARERQPPSAGATYQLSARRGACAVPPPAVRRARSSRRNRWPATASPRSVDPRIGVGRERHPDVRQHELRALVKRPAIRQAAQRILAEEDGRDGDQPHEEDDLGSLRSFKERNAFSSVLTSKPHPGVAMVPTP